LPNYGDVYGDGVRGRSLSAAQVSSIVSPTTRQQLVAQRSRSTWSCSRALNPWMAQAASQGTVASGPKVPLAGSKVEPLPVQTAGRSAQSDQSWHRQWRSGTLVEDASLSGRQMQQCLHDRDAKFCRGFDQVFRSDGGEVLRTPVRASTANAHAERWVRTVRAEGLDWLLIVGRGHLEQLLRI
jgi:hypothetical protein